MTEPLSNSESTFTQNSGDDIERQVQNQPLPLSGSIQQKDDPFLVMFEADDADNPKNWSRMKRWYLTALGGILVLNATFASSAPSGVLEDVMEKFHFGEEVATLNISLFVAGYCLGPLLWGPLSEQYGRRPIYIVTFLVYTAFQVGCALSQNTASLLIFRLLGGIFAACSLTNSGALISDIWDADTRGKALGLFTLAPFAGPALGPIVSGYIATANVSWRWLFLVLTIFAGVCWLFMVFTLPETYAPLILVKKARQIRKKTGDERYHAPLEVQDKAPFRQRIENILARPFRIMFEEPMLVAVTIYMSFVYGCIYLLLEAYPIVFTEGHNMNAGTSGLMYLPIFCGGILAVLLYVLIFNPRYERAIEEYAPDPVPPEARLEIAMWGAPIFAISFFWFGWTSYPSISFWSPMMSGLLMGWSVVFIFLALFNYIIDAYLFVAASALAANTVIRSIFGAAFPLFATQMFDALNPRWASTLLGCIAILLLPIPFVLKKYGHVIRARSKNAPTPAKNKEKELKV